MTLTHGMYRRPEYRIWLGMVERCTNVSSPHYVNYGARGITICERWRHDFAAFYADMGPRPTPKHQIDREDNDGPYAPGNCRWATPRQNANNRRNTVLLTAFGETKSASEWARDSRCAVPFFTLWNRLARRGYTAERAITAPVDSTRGLLTRGINSAMAKLSEDDVRRLRSRRKDGLKYRELAIEFDISPSNACFICRGITWSHLK